jgi:mercuric ion transport protein
MRMKGLLDKIGPAGAIITALCCLGLPVLISLLTAIGAGFLITDKFLLPLLALFLAVSVWGGYVSYRRHGRHAVVVVSVLGAVLTFAGVWLHWTVVAIGLALLIASPVLSFMSLRSLHSERG